ncbi:MAG: cysteine desulfurase [Eubacteriaceae bacterium]|nr:cysteine desulfurase [Eubacteriaceae bacterium]
MGEKYYFDNAASTRPYGEVTEGLRDYCMNCYANPSSNHSLGFEALKTLDFASEWLLKELRLPSKNYEVIYTSGATESANLALRGTIERSERLLRSSFAITSIEHHCVSQTAAYLERRGATSCVLKVDKLGQLIPESVSDGINSTTSIASIIWVNNETGAAQDIKGIVDLVKGINPSTLVHIDAAQAFGKVTQDISGVDMVSISGHKFHAPKGVGALIVKKGLQLAPIIFGGGQQKNLRSGTINAPMIYAMGKAARIGIENGSKEQLQELSSYLLKCFVQEFGEEPLNSMLPEGIYSPHILNVSFESLKGEVFMRMLEEQDVFVSTSSACSSKAENKDSALYAMGYGKKRVDSALRISISVDNTKGQIDYLIDKIKNIKKRLSH